MAQLVAYLSGGQGVAGSSPASPTYTRGTETVGAPFYVAAMTEGLRSRRWTDDQLRAAIRTSRSWRAVARALGLKGTSAGVIRTIRKHADRLELDVSHFTGQRSWSDDQLREAVQRAATWSDVARRLGMHDGTTSALAKAHSVRLQLETSHLEPAAEPPMDADVYSREVRPEALRKAATAIASAWFLLRSMPVAVPVEPEVFDLLVTMPRGIRRVQVKTSTFKTPTGSWEVGIGHRPYTHDKLAGKVPYDPDSLDYFFIVDGDGRLFLIPVSAVAGRLRIWIDRYLHYQVGDTHSLMC